MSLVSLTEPYNLGELILLQSLLEGSGIEYVVQHAHMGSLYPGVPGLNSCVMVDEDDQPRAELLLRRLRLDVREVSGEA
jgi:Putative prokaryotic signal transducing protein